MEVLSSASTASQTTLDEAQTAWIELHDRLRDLPKNQGRLAAPFVSTPDPTPYDHSRPAVMLVGQATRGEWFAPNYERVRSRPLPERLRERRLATANFLTNPVYAKHRRSAFWRVLGRLKSLAGGQVIWSNVAKIGIRSGNPDWRLVVAQADLATATLQAEIDHYHPKLVVFVSGYLGRHEVLAPLLNIAREQSSDRNGIFHIRYPERNRPALLWTCHPRSTRANPCAWLEVVTELLNLEH